MELKNKRVLITGADGFIGSHLVQRMLGLTSHVKAFVYYNSFGSNGWLDDIPVDQAKQVEIISGDIRDPYRVRKAAEGCDIVLHLAALIAIPYSYSAPDSYVDTNIKGTLNVLTAARELSLEKVIVTSTSEVYGTAKYVPIDEDHPLQAQSPYAATKIAADQLAMSFHKSFSTPVTILRPFNTFGPRQSARAVIPTIITQIANGSTKLQLGSLSPTRDLNYIADTVDGFICAARSSNAVGRTINLGSGVEISIGALAQKIADLMEVQIDIQRDVARERPEESEVNRLLAENRLAAELLGWSPKYSLDDGLRLTISWFKDKANLRKYKSDAYNI